MSSAPTTVELIIAADRGVQSSATFTHSVDSLSEGEWYKLLLEFQDANIFQTPPFCSIKSPRSRVERFILKQGAHIVAATLVRVASLPLTGTGFAYVRWGPMWIRKDEGQQNANVWRAVLRALRQEYVLKRKMCLRVLPRPSSDEPENLSIILQEEGFAKPDGPAGWTMILDLTRPLEELRKGLDVKWRGHLSGAEKKNLQILEGTDDGLFEQFMVPYQEMISRKGLNREPGDIGTFRAMQKSLPDELKTRAFICICDGTVGAGAIVSAYGDTGIYHFGATGDVGAKAKASYLIHWRAIQWLKEVGCTRYDLHGVNQQVNPGVYSFKAGLCGKNGREVAYLGRYEATHGTRSRLVAKVADLGLQQVRRLKTIRAARRPAE
jgi:lipid II:glycine glycyltransferase (peptidoglycan interpeptide bridge formation enzyme)